MFYYAIISLCKNNIRFNFDFRGEYPRGVAKSKAMQNWEESFLEGSFATSRLKGDS